MEWRNEDGSTTWEYSRQPEGVECFMITVGGDGILRGIEQVLNEEIFARVENGMNGDQAGGEPAYFTVSFNNDGRVTGTGRYTRYRGH